MIWPFSRWLGKSRDRRQVCESLSRLAERDLRQIHEAKLENSAAANSAILAVEYRHSRSNHLRDVVADVVDRQRDRSLTHAEMDRGR